MRPLEVTIEVYFDVFPATIEVTGCFPVTQKGKIVILTNPPEGDRSGGGGGVGFGRSGRKTVAEKSGCAAGFQRPSAVVHRD